jgi:ABC-2 type transport system ATP-binding protein
MAVEEYLRFAAEVRGLDEPTFKSRLKKVVEVCGLAQVLSKDIGTLSHGYRQRVGLGQALIHDPPILILDEPTSDLDPNEKAEVLRYIERIGKDRTVLLSTHNLAEVEEACARAIIVSKGRVVADGPIENIRAQTGRIRYVVTIDEKNAEAGNKPPSATEIQDALKRVSGAMAVRELPSDESAHRFELTGPHDSDLRAEIYRLMVAKSWTLLELRRDAQSLDAVFRDLTRGDERADRGEDWEGDDEGDEEDGEDEEDEEEESDEDEGEGPDSGDEDEEEDEEEDEKESAHKEASKS